MKKIASLIAASFCLLALSAPATAAERWGWSDLAAQSWKEAWLDLSHVSWAPAAEVLKYASAVATPKVDVVPVPLDPKLIKQPGALAAIAPSFEDALDAVRKVVADDPVVARHLEAEGYKLDDVVGFGKLKDGTVAVFVDNAA